MLFSKGTKCIRRNPEQVVRNLRADLWIVRHWVEYPTQRTTCISHMAHNELRKQARITVSARSRRCCSRRWSSKLMFDRYRSGRKTGTFIISLAFELCCPRANESHSGMSSCNSYQNAAKCRICKTKYWYKESQLYAEHSGCGSTAEQLWHCWLAGVDEVMRRLL